VKWLARLKRRTPGIYAYRTRRHDNPFRTQWGYVGESWHLDARDRDHAGTGRFNVAQKPWYDLVVRRYTLRLPWWLGWKWVIRSLETLAILLLNPRYNWKKNPRKSKAGPRLQAIERSVRDQLDPGYQAQIKVRRVLDIVIRAGATLMIIIGIGGYLWTR